MRIRPLLSASSGTRGALLAALLLAGVGGCSTIDWDPMQRETEFTETQRTFTQYVRWGHFEEASLYVVSAQRGEFLSLAPALSDVRFTDYRIIDLDLADGYQSAEVEVQYSGYRLSVPVERTFQVSQSWAVEDDGQWRVRLELAKFREALQVPQP
jgi:hypothetical protein